MCTAKPPKPTKPVTLPPPAQGEIIDPQVLSERERERARQRTAGGRSSTMLASVAQGYMAPTAQAKTAMGS